MADSTELAWQLRRATRRYGSATRRALEAAGFEALPLNGVWALRALAERPQTATELAVDLDVTKQAVSILVEALAAMGLLERSPHPDDRRRVLLSLTARGRESAEIIERASSQLERHLADHAGPGELATFRKVLTAFVTS